MNPDLTATPSAGLKVPVNAEHMEAKQSAIDAERLAFIKTQSPEMRIRYRAVEKAIKILTEAECPFHLVVRPDPTNPNRAIAGTWNHCKFSYKQPLSEAWNQEVFDTAYTILIQSVETLSKPLGLHVAICGEKGQIQHLTPGFPTTRAES